MIICFECRPETKKSLDSLLATGNYKDYSEILSTAVENLAVLQGEVSRRGSLIIGGDVPEEARKLAGEKTFGSHRNQKSIRATQQNDFAASRVVGQPPVSIPHIFSVNGIIEASKSPIELPHDTWTSCQEVPLDQWFFGQYNKLLPAKANCRALAHLLTTEPEGVSLAIAPTRIAKEAAVLGEYLSNWDRKNGINRDDALATAFPVTGSKGEKGRLRYATHFVASENKQGKVSGLLIDLKLINYVAGEETQILLTEAGWHFASLPNPVLDNVQESPTHKFNNEEITFLLGHISKTVHIEDFAYRAILTAIHEGSDTPDKIDQALQKYVPHDSSRNLSKSFLSSQRSGTVSRMADLGLLKRIRDGVKVTYLLTELGTKYLQAAVQYQRRNIS